MLGTGQAKLTLGELRGATCLVQTSLLALHDASVAGQEASFFTKSFLYKLLFQYARNG